MDHFVKLTNHSCNHNGMEYEDGLNEDILDFNPVNKCVAGGLYFCDVDSFGRWTYYGGEKMTYVWDVTIPADASVVVMANGKFKCNKFILSNKRSIWDNDQLCYRAVTTNGFALKFAENKTEALCLRAVKQSGWNIRFVENQTEEMKEEVRNQGEQRFLEFIKD